MPLRAWTAALAALVALALTGAGPGTPDYGTPGATVPTVPDPEGPIPKVPDPPPKPDPPAPPAVPPAAPPPTAPPPTTPPPTVQRPPPRPTSDRFNFASLINAHRARHGLHALAYEQTLDGWCRANNVACQRVLGGGAPRLPGNRDLHQVFHPSSWQNACFGSANVGEIFSAWVNSPGHNTAMLQPGVTRYGIEYGPGPYWTLTLH